MGLSNYVSTYQHDYAGRRGETRSRSRSFSAAPIHQNSAGRIPTSGRPMTRSGSEVYFHFWGAGTVSASMAPLVKIWFCSILGIFKNICLNICRIISLSKQRESFQEMWSMMWVFQHCT